MLECLHIMWAIRLILSIRFWRVIESFNLNFNSIVLTYISSLLPTLNPTIINFFVGKVGDFTSVALHPLQANNFDPNIAASLLVEPKATCRWIREKAHVAANPPRHYCWIRNPNSNIVATCCLIQKLSPFCCQPRCGAPAGRCEKLIPPTQLVLQCCCMKSDRNNWIEIFYPKFSTLK